MGRLSISNLSKELKVNPKLVYRAMDRLGIAKQGMQEFTLEVYEQLRAEVKKSSDKNKQAVEDRKKANLSAKNVTLHTDVTPQQLPPMTNKEVSTLRERLAEAKQEYEFNRDMIELFQKETMEYIRINGKTTMMGRNLVESSIPSLVNLDKYTRLNQLQSRLISNLEEELDLTPGGDDDDPFQ